MALIGSIQYGVCDIEYHIDGDNLGNRISPVIRRQIRFRAADARWRHGIVVRSSDEQMTPALMIGLSDCLHVLRQSLCCLWKITFPWLSPPLSSQRRMSARWIRTKKQRNAFSKLCLYTFLLPSLYFQFSNRLLLQVGKFDLVGAFWSSFFHPGGSILPGCDIRNTQLKLTAKKDNT